MEVEIGNLLKQLPIYFLYINLGQHTLRWDNLQEELAHNLKTEQDYTNFFEKNG
jgi:hypothetical protein